MMAIAASGRAESTSPPAVRFAAAAGIFLIAWFSRGLELDRLVTPDEPLWLARSANFHNALAERDLDTTYQYVHPGVTVMWIGALSYRWSVPDYADRVDGPIITRGASIQNVLTELGADPLAAMVAAREALVVAICAVLAMLAWYAIRLFGLGAGLLGSALIALDPFHVALSRLLHLDGLFSCLFTLAAAVWLVYLLDGRRRRDLVVAGIALGLAGLTRSLAVSLVPLILMSAVIEARRLGPAWIRPAGRSFAGVGVIALATFVLGWPALWSSPFDTTERFVRGTLELGGEAHARPIYFAGAIHSTDPGLLFYPVSLAWRVSPPVMIGMLPALMGIGLAFRRGREDRHALAAAYLLAAAFCVLLMLTASPKKFDRYVLPAIPAIGLVSAYGWRTLAAATSRLFERRGAASRFVAPAAGAAVLLFWSAGLTAVSHPYGLGYYNPLLGGAPAARAHLMIGWGEGLDQIAKELNREEYAGLVAITPGWRAPITYFTDSVRIGTIDFNDPEALSKWVRADLFIRYITSDQRGYVPEAMLAYLDGLEPIRTVQLAGLDYAALYDLRSAPVPEPLLAGSTPVPLPTGVAFLAGALPSEPVPAGAEATVLLLFTGTPTTAERQPLTLELLDGAGNVVASIRGTYGAPERMRTVWTVRRRIPIPVGMPDGPYAVRARFGDGAGSAGVPLGTIVLGEPAPAAETDADAIDDEP